MKYLKASEEFRVGKNKIAYVSEDFQDDFHGMYFETDTAPLYSKKLGKEMASAQIQEELNPTEVTLGQLYHAMQSGEMDKDVWGYLAYVKNQNGVARLVSVFWSDDGWNFDSDSVDYASGWSGDRRVFSGNSRFGPKTPKTLGPSEPLTLEITEIVVNGKTYRLVS